MNKEEPGTLSDYARFLNLERAENGKLKDTIRTLTDVTLGILDDLETRDISVNNSEKLRASIQRIRADI